MVLIEPGRVCIKTKGKERNKPCVIVEVVDDKFVIIDGLVKRRRCNINHLKLLDKVIKLKKFEKSEILNAFVREGILSKEKLEKIKKKEEVIKARAKVKKEISKEKKEKVKEEKKVKKEKKERKEKKKEEKKEAKSKKKK